MKNLMIYINPRKDFDDEGKVTVKIQIDNSLDLGWKKEDILLITNFPYRYRGIKSIVVANDNFCDWNTYTTKLYTIPYLFKQNLIKNREIYWVHDFDVFQNVDITESEIVLELGTADLGLTDKGRMPRFNGGSVFFKKSSKDIFNRAKEISLRYNTSDELALKVLATNNLLWVTDPEPEKNIGDRIAPINIPGMENAGERIKKINISYNFRTWNIRSTIRMAIKPIRIVHFHPLAKESLDFFMYGKNKLGIVLMPERLIKIFHHHGIS